MSTVVRLTLDLAFWSANYETMCDWCRQVDAASPSNNAAYREDYVRFWFARQDWPVGLALLAVRDQGGDPPVLELEFSSETDAILFKLSLYP